MGMKPLEQLDHCLLGKDARFAECRMECAHCGWNDEEAERRTTHSAEMVRGRAAAEDFAAETAH